MGYCTVTCLRMRNKSATQTQRKQANDDNLHFLDVRLCN